MYMYLLLLILAQKPAFGGLFCSGARATLPMVWCWCYDSICMTTLPTIVLALLASDVNDDGCLEPWQARGSMLNDT